MQTSPTTDINVLLLEVADSVKGLRGPVPLPPFIFEQTEAQRAEKKKILRPPPPPLSQGLDNRAPPYLLRNLIDGVTWKSRPTQGNGRYKRPEPKMYVYNGYGSLVDQMAQIRISFKNYTKKY